MCGIAGMIDVDGRDSVDVTALERMVNALYLRGPDDHGTCVRPPVAMGIRRLSIIDLATGHQPISNEDDTIHVVLNGELYSYVELRAELLALGHTFRTHSDTEVLVHGYESWGLEGLLERLNGMFAFALYDEGAGTVHIARDRLGIKPLVYTQRDGVFYFASTIAALRASGKVPIEPDPLGVRLYLQQQFVPGPTTAIAGVRKLPPASYITVGRGRVAEPTRYWKLPAREDDRRSVSEWHTLLRTLVDDAVCKRMRADVEVGVFLSGGIDSSVVLGLMTRHTQKTVEAFTVGFKEEGGFDESPYARMAAERFGARLHPIDFDAARFGGDLRNIVGQLDEPIGDAACIPMFYLSREARRHVKVVLTGEGADELFAGYGYYRRLATPMARVMERAKRFTRGAAVSASSGYPYVMLPGDVDALTPAFGRSVNVEHAARALESRWTDSGGKDPLNTAARIDMGGWLVDDLLMKVDSTSMTYSLEARVPFLDHRVVEAAMTMPGRMKRTGRTGKVVLRDAFLDLLGADLAGRGKHGFSLPLASWFRGPLRSLLDQMEGSLDDVPWLDRRVVERLVAEHLAGRDRARLLWVLYVLITWYSTLCAPASEIPAREE
jgi:asparagine synthase (glutamine-hydrolysing)